MSQAVGQARFDPMTGERLQGRAEQRGVWAEPIVLGGVYRKESADGQSYVEGICVTVEKKGDDVKGRVTTLQGEIVLDRMTSVAWKFTGRTLIGAKDLGPAFEAPEPIPTKADRVAEIARAARAK